MQKTISFSVFFVIVIAYMLFSYHSKITICGKLIDELNTELNDVSSRAQTAYYAKNRSYDELSRAANNLGFYSYQSANPCK